MSTLPRLLDIFSPSASTTKAWCIQWLAKRLPRATAWARSFSWCGKRRSIAAAVQVEALAEQVEAHHDALAVPARPALAPRRRPRRLARLGQLPQHEVGRVALELGADDLALAAAGEHLVERLVGQQAVVRRPSRRTGRRRRRSCRRGPSSTSCADHRRPSRRRTRWRGGCRRAGRRRGGPGRRTTPASHFARDLLPRPLLGVGPVDDLVVDVGDVGDQPHVEPGPAQVARRARRRRCSGGRGRGAAGA